jgi:hypothetical protein
MSTNIDLEAYKATITRKSKSLDAGSNTLN